MTEQDDVPTQAPTVSTPDTPIRRATVNELTIADLDHELEAIRSRRLRRVRQLEEIAKVKADEARLDAYMKFEKALTRARKLLDSMKEDEDKAEQAVNKLRILVIEMEA